MTKKTIFVSKSVAVTFVMPLIASHLTSLKINKN